jgi:hypothetical protein
MWNTNQMDKISRKMNSSWSQYWRMKGLEPNVERYQKRFNKIVGALDHENLRKLALKERCDEEAGKRDEAEMIRRLSEAELDWYDALALKILAWQYVFGDFYFKSTRGEQFVRYSFYQPNQGHGSFPGMQQLCRMLWGDDPWSDKPESAEEKQEHRQDVLRRRAEREESTNRDNKHDTIQRSERGEAVGPKPNISSADGGAATIDKSLYAVPWDELESGRFSKGLWARVFSENNGDDEKTRAAYIRARVKELEVQRQETKNKTEIEKQKKIQQEIQRKAREEAERKAEEGAQKRAREEAERKAEEAWQAAREDRERARQEAARARQEAAEKAIEEVRQKTKEQIDEKKHEELQKAKRKPLKNIVVFSTILLFGSIIPGLYLLNKDAPDSIEVGEIQKVKNAISKNWNIPFAIKSLPVKANPLRFQVEVSKDGDILQVRQSSSSGYSQWDESAENAIWKTAPFVFPRALFKDGEDSFSFEVVFDPQSSN